MKGNRYLSYLPLALFSVAFIELLCCGVLMVTPFIKPFFVPKKQEKTLSDPIFVRFSDIATREKKQAALIASGINTSGTLTLSIANGIIGEAIDTPTPTPAPSDTPTPQSSIISQEISAIPVDTSVDTTTIATPAAQPQTSSLNAEILFSLVNQHRTSIGLPNFEKDERICQVAASRAPELYNEIWVTHTMHAGFYARNLPYWATENIISMTTEQSALNWWLNSPIHRQAIEGNYKYSCVACYSNNCSEIFTNFEPKIFIPTLQPTVSSTPESLKN